MKEFNIYIDESGDEGINRGSKYFILTAIIVKKDNDLEISKYVDKIKISLEMDVKNHTWNTQIDIGGSKNLSASA